jgi:hypothetical protein
MSFINGKLIFHKIVSSRTCYGLIWSGTYQGVPCIIKMVMLTTGVHYHKSSKSYRNEQGHSKSIPQPFLINDPQPFLHREFIHRRSMTPDDFNKEVNELTQLSQIGLAPKVFAHGVCDRVYEIHYGFIVMEQTDCSLKDVILKRSLHNKESKLVENLIDQIHKEQHIAHGDLKPSNIGVYLDRDRNVKRCVVFDCLKIRHKDQFNESDFKKFVESDWRTYKKHLKLNRKGKPRG